MTQDAFAKQQRVFDLWRLLPGASVLSCTVLHLAFAGKQGTLIYRCQVSVLYPGKGTTIPCLSKGRLYSKGSCWGHWAVVPYSLGNCLPKNLRDGCLSAVPCSQEYLPPKLKVQGQVHWGQSRGFQLGRHQVPHEDVGRKSSCNYSSLLYESS